VIGEVRTGTRVSSSFEQRARPAHVVLISGRAATAVARRSQPRRPCAYEVVRVCPTKPAAAGLALAGISA